MLLFSFLKDIIEKKRGKLLDKMENHSEFEPYLMQRWLSMYSNEYAKIINCTTNFLYPAFESKDDWYKFFLILCPSSPNKKIKYIRKIAKEKKQKDDTGEVIKYLAKSNQMSEREIKLYIQESNLDLCDLKKALKKD